MKVPRGTRGTPTSRRAVRCSTCHTNPPRAGQATCADCHAAEMRACRARQKAQVQAMAWDLRALRTRIEKALAS